MRCLFFLTHLSLCWFTKPPSATHQTNNTSSSHTPIFYSQTNLRHNPLAQTRLLCYLHAVSELPKRDPPAFKLSKTLPTQTYCAPNILTHTKPYTSTIAQECLANTCPLGSGLCLLPNTRPFPTPLSSLDAFRPTCGLQAFGIIFKPPHPLPLPVRTWSDTTPDPAHLLFLNGYTPGSGLPIPVQRPTNLPKWAARATTQPT